MAAVAGTDPAYLTVPQPFTPANEHFAGSIVLCDVDIFCGKRIRIGEVTMDLAKQARIVESIHDTLDDFVGQRIKVRANMGRSKIVESEGVLTQVHPRLFIMEVERKRGRTARQSYQYADVLTGTVELSQGGEPLFGEFIDDSVPEPEPSNLELFEDEERVLA